MFKQQYVVNLFIHSSHEYLVEAMSEEEAIEIAENRYETDEDDGKQVWYEVEEAVAHGEED